MKSLSDQLQNKEIDMVLAAQLVVSTSETLRSIRSDDTWKQTFKYINDVANLHNITTAEPRRHRIRRQPMMDGFVSFEATASDSQRESFNDSNALKTSIYYPVWISFSLKWIVDLLQLIWIS